MAPPRRKKRSASSAEDSTSQQQNEPQYPLDLGEVIKSPIDTNSYKVIELKNGLKALLVSTCVHKRAVCKHQELPKKIEEFNENYLNDDKNEDDEASSQDSNQALPQQPDSNTNESNSNDNRSSKYMMSIPSFAEIWAKIRKSLSFKSSNKSPEENSGSSSLSPPPAKSSKTERCCSGVASVSIVVGVGSLHDPNDVQGMAHLVEHVTLLGSKQFPKPSEIFVKVAESKGIVNASTLAEQTLYNLHCGMSGFENCLKILVDGIVNPILDEEVIRGEIQVIDSEYDIKKTDDPTRIGEFTSSLAKSGHPMKSFYWGNKITLDKEDIVEKIVEWRERYYKATYMTVCIQAPLPLRELETLANEHFGDIPSAPQGTPAPSEEIAESGNPFTIRKTKKYLIVPVTRLTCLEITWCLPPGFWQNYEAKPLHYICTLLSCPAAGGLVEFLRKRNWISEYRNAFANSSSSDGFCRNSFGSQFTITIILTDKGYDQKEKVVDAIFSYINFLKKSGVVEAYANDMKESLANAFHFQDWEDIEEMGMPAALALQRAAPIHVFTSQTLMTRYCPETIQECLEELNPRKACFFFISQQNINVVKKKAGQCKIPYVEVNITEERYSKLENIKPSRSFQLFPEGTFRPKKLCLDWGTAPARNNAEDLYQDRKLYICHMGGPFRGAPFISTKVPSASITIVFNSPAAAEEGSKFQRGVMELWLKITQDRVNYKLGNRYDYLFQYDLLPDTEGFSINVTGPSCHLCELIETIVNATFLDENVVGSGSKAFFEDMRLDLFRELVNKMIDVETLATDASAYLRLKLHVPIWEMKDTIKTLTYSKFEELRQGFKKFMNAQVELEGLVHDYQVKRIKNVIKSLTYQPPPQGRIASIREQTTIFPKVRHVLWLKALHPAFVTSVVINCYQFGVLEGNQKQFYFRLLYHYMRKRIFRQLRTKEHLGYTVVLSSLTDCGSFAFYVIVLAHNKFSTKHVDSRIDNFMKSFFNKFLSEKQDPRNSLFSKHQRNDPPKEFSELREFYAEHLLPEGNNFRKLSIQVTGFPPNQTFSKKDQEKLNPQDAKGEKNQDLCLKYLPEEGSSYKDSGVSAPTVFITDIKEFKETLEFSPPADDDD